MTRRMQVGRRAMLLAAAVALAAVPGAFAHEHHDKKSDHHGEQVAPGGGQGEQPTAVTLERARQELAELLASESTVRLDFQATSYDGAMDLIDRAVDVYLGEAVGRLGSPEKALDWGRKIITAINTHRMIFEVKTLGKKTIPIVNEADANALGELMGNVMGILLRIGKDGERPISIDGSARKILGEVILDSGERTPLINQYLRSVKTFSDEPTVRLERFISLR